MQLELETGRLVLRPMSLDDLEICLDLRTDMKVMQFVGETRTPEQVRNDMPVMIRRGGGGIGIWIASEKTSGQKIGEGILLPLPIEQEDTDWDLMHGDELPDAEIEVGYMLKPAAWGKGYATEIATRLIRFAFEATPLDEVVAVTDPRNIPSRQVLLKSGMTHRGMRRAYTCELPDFHVTRAQWAARGTSRG